MLEDKTPEGAPETPQAAQEENQASKRSKKKPPLTEARFYALAILAFALLLAAFPVYRAASEAAAAAQKTPAPTAEPTPPPASEPPAPTPTYETPAPTETPQVDPTEEAPVYVQTAVVVGGKTLGVLASREAAEELLHDVKAHYEAMIEGEGRLTSSFEDEVELKDAPEVTELTTLEALYETLVNGRRPLQVETVLQAEATRVLAHEAVERRDDTLLKGLRVVKSLGRDGEGSVITRTTYVNGKKKKTVTDAETVAQSSEDRVIFVGTLSPKGGEPGRHEGTKGKDAGELAFAAPAAEKIVSNFGRRDGGFHLGLDYALGEGDSVYAAEKGAVVSVLVRGNYGLTIEIDHGNGFLTRYAHLGSALVKLGDAVEKGDEIATAGAESYGEKGGLHFELRIDGFAFNPRYYLP